MKYGILPRGFDRKSAWSIPLVITVDNFEELFDTWDFFPADRVFDCTSLMSVYII